MKIMCNSNFSLTKVLLEHCPAHPLLLMAAFMLQWQS